MKNNKRKDKQINEDTNPEIIQQKLPMSNAPSRPTSQMPVRTADRKSNHFTDLNFNQMPAHNQQKNQMQNNQTPLYVPPFLMNNVRQSRHHNHDGPRDYLPWSVVNIFICVLIAMPALYFSIQTREMKRAGNVKQAKRNSKRSLVLNIIASVLGLLIILLAIILRFAVYQLIVHNDVQSQNVPIIAGG